jgi:hypothetical protein
MTKPQEEVDFGWDHYLQELDDDLSFVDVGITAKDGAQKHGPTEEGKQTDITLAQLATIQEFGTVIAVTPKMRGFLSATGMNLSSGTTTITIPSRPYMRQTFDEELKNLQTRADELEFQVLTKGISKRSALNELGQMHVNQIQKNMKTSGKWEENHPYTIEKKGSSQPLIDSGRLRQSINFEVG